jgi:hypothetical protein
MKQPWQQRRNFRYYIVKVTPKTFLFHVYHSLCLTDIIEMELQVFLTSKSLSWFHYHKSPVMMPKSEYEVRHVPTQNKTKPSGEWVQFLLRTESSRVQISVRRPAFLATGPARRKMYKLPPSLCLLFDKWKPIPTDLLFMSWQLIASHLNTC